MGSVTHGFQIGLLEADVEEPEVLIKLDLGRHDQKTSSRAVVAAGTGCLVEKWDMMRWED